MKQITATVELRDGSSHTININNPSLVAWDRTRAMRQWPKTSDAPMLWLTFIAWHHMKAAGLVTCEYKEFEETECLNIESDDAEADDDDGADVDPTRPAPAVDYA